MSKQKLTVLLAGALMLAGSNARSDTITPSSDTFIAGVSMAYEASLSSGHLEPGDGFTIFDIGGFTGIIAVPLGWSVGSTAPLNNPWGIAPGGVDDPLLPNLTFVYSGATIHQEFGETTFSSFIVGTTSTSLVVDDWTSRDHNITPVGNDWVLGVPHTDQILVPAPIRAVPDGGATLGLLGCGLMLLSVLGARFKA